MASGAFGIWADSIILQPPEQLKSPIDLVIRAHMEQYSSVITFLEYQRLKRIPSFWSCYLIREYIRAENA